MIPIKSELVMYCCLNCSSESSWLVSIIIGISLLGIITLVVMDLIGDDVLICFCFCCCFFMSRLFIDLMGDGGVGGRSPT